MTAIDQTVADAPVTDGVLLTDVRQDDPRPALEPTIPGVRQAIHLHSLRREEALPAGFGLAGVEGGPDAIEQPSRRIGPGPGCLAVDRALLDEPVELERIGRQ